MQIWNRFYFLGCFPNYTKYILLFKNACVSIYLQFDAYIFTNEKLLSSFFAIFWMFKSFELPDFVIYEKNCDYSTILISGESMHVAFKSKLYLSSNCRIRLVYQRKATYISFFLLTRYKSYLFYQNLIISQY